MTFFVYITKAGNLTMTRKHCGFHDTGIHQKGGGTIAGYVKAANLEDALLVLRELLELNKRAKP